MTERQSSPRIVDTLCNAFTPDRRELWSRSIASSGLQVKVRSDDTDSFAEPAEMVDRMDELGIATVLLPAADIGMHGRLDPFDYQHIATQWGTAEALAEKWPGRFAALAVLNFDNGMTGVNQTRARLREPWVVGMYSHTHSWDRRFDDATYYPYYALASDFDVPIGMQAGTSGGLMFSECGHPIGIDRPAIYFPDTRFVLSHTGWPWVDEAIAMALKFPNVYLGTGSYPPRHWPPTLRSFLGGPGKAKVIFATNFPTTGHRHALGQFSELDLTPEVADGVLGGNARRIYTRLSGLAGNGRVLPAV
jgi:uncharacterized protein